MIHQHKLDSVRFNLLTSLSSQVQVLSFLRCILISGVESDFRSSLNVKQVKRFVLIYIAENLQVFLRLWV